MSQLAHAWIAPIKVEVDSREALLMSSMKLPVGSIPIVQK
jgi:hypothetical protein